MPRPLAALVVALLFAGSMAAGASAQTPAPVAPSVSPLGDTALPIYGGYALVTWPRGPLEGVRAAAEVKGCRAASAWVTRDGRFVGHVFGAPAIVQQAVASASAFPGDEVPPGTPLLIVCRVTTALAPIESIEIRVGESSPPQYFVHVRSGLPDGCARYHDYDVEREPRSGGAPGRAFEIRVFNRVPARGAQLDCPAVKGIVDTTIPLGSDFVSGVAYSVLVNNVKTTFVAQ